MDDSASAKPLPELPAWRAFVVQFSREEGVFSGRIEHLSSGRRARFSSRDELVATLAAFLDQLGADTATTKNQA